MRLALILALAAGTARADCPPPPDQAAQRDALHARLAVAATPADAQVISDALWELWLVAPDEAAQALLDEGIARRNGYDMLGSVEVLSRLVDYCPDYAEGWNQRAFTYFLAHDFEAALADLDRALALHPRHLGALTGRALTLIGLGREAEAHAVLRGALDLNPWLAERELLPGQDI